MFVCVLTQIFFSLSDGPFLKIIIILYNYHITIINSQAGLTKREIQNENQRKRQSFAVLDEFVFPLALPFDNSGRQCNTDTQPTGCLIPSIIMIKVVITIMIILIAVIMLIALAVTQRSAPHPDTRSHILVHPHKAAAHRPSEKKMRPLSAKNVHSVKKTKRTQKGGKERKKHQNKIKTKAQR